MKHLSAEWTAAEVSSQEREFCGEQQRLLDLLSVARQMYAEAAKQVPIIGTLVPGPDRSQMQAALGELRNSVVTAEESLGAHCREHRCAESRAAHGS